MFAARAYCETISRGSRHFLAINPSTIISQREREREGSRFKKKVTRWERRVEKEREKEREKETRIDIDKTDRAWQDFRPSDSLVVCRKRRASRPPP